MFVTFLFSELTSKPFLNLQVRCTTVLAILFLIIDAQCKYNNSLLILHIHHHFDREFYKGSFSIFQIVAFSFHVDDDRKFNCTFTVEQKIPLHGYNPFGMKIFPNRQMTYYKNYATVMKICNKNTFTFRTGRYIYKTKKLEYLQNKIKNYVPYPM